MMELNLENVEMAAAVSMATEAAVILGEYPLARNIALALATLLANPEGMRGAAEAWTAPTAKGKDCVEFETIIHEVRTLTDEMADKEWWKGSAAELCKQSTETLTEQLKIASSYHQGVGQGLHTIAALYSAAVVLAATVASVLMYLAWLKLLSWLGSIPQQIATRGTINAILAKLALAVRTMVSKQLKSVGGLATILALINAACATLSQVIDKNRPKADFSQVALEYVPNDSTGVGTLQRKNSGMPGLDMSSLTGGNGFI
ncbi:hypothetical protein [Nonomuraea sp. NPDC049695]|uniref:hypothetical protein n=1 Tax=Nonomuraea sp. NPDC049695 TaxID=3154734 RepID=UPI003446B0DE